MFKVKGQGHNVKYQQQKRYKMTADRFSDFKLGVMGVIIKADEAWRGVGRPQVAVHRNCHIF